MDAKQYYASRLFGLQASQIRYFGELSKRQVEEARKYFSAGLVNMGQYIYAVKGDGGLVWRRERRDPLLESSLAPGKGPIGR